MKKILSLTLVLTLCLALLSGCRQKLPDPQVIHNPPQAAAASAGTVTINCSDGPAQFTKAEYDYFVATYTKPASFDTISTYVVNATRGSQTDIKTALWALSTVIFAIVLIICIGMNRSSAGKDKKKVNKMRRANA